MTHQQNKQSILRWVVSLWLPGFIGASAAGWFIVCTPRSALFWPLVVFMPLLITTAVTALCAMPESARRGWLFRDVSIEFSAFCATFLGGVVTYYAFKSPSVKPGGWMIVVLLWVVSAALWGILFARYRNRRNRRT